MIQRAVQTVVDFDHRYVSTVNGAAVTSPTTAPRDSAGDPVQDRRPAAGAVGHDRDLRARHHPRRARASRRRLHRVSLPGVEIRVADLNDVSATVPVGNPGELMARGPIVMMGYYGNQLAAYKRPGR